MLTTAISQIEPSFRTNRPLQAMVVVFLAFSVWSAIDPVYPADWVLENILTTLAVVILVAT